jgi:hypothetical protein
MIDCRMLLPGARVRVVVTLGAGNASSASALQGTLLPAKFSAAMHVTAAAIGPLSFEGGGVIFTYTPEPGGQGLSDGAIVGSLLGHGESWVADVSLLRVPGQCTLRH